MSQSSNGRQGGPPSVVEPSGEGEGEAVAAVACAAAGEGAGEARAEAAAGAGGRPTGSRQGSRRGAAPVDDLADRLLPLAQLLRRLDDGALGVGHGVERLARRRGYTCPRRWAAPGQGQGEGEVRFGV